jgi:hypothetical protein
MWAEGSVARYAIREPGANSFGAARTPTNWIDVDDVRFDADGTAVAVYRSGNAVRVAVRPAAGEFGAPQELDALSPFLVENNGTIGPATLAADGRGSVYAAWGARGYGASGASGINGPWSYVKSAVRPSGGSFAAAPDPDQFCGVIGSCLPDYPALAASHKAGAVVASHVQTGYGNATLRAVSVADGKVLFGGGAYDPFPPVVAIDGLGAVTLGWVAQRRIYLRTKPPTRPAADGPPDLAGTGLRLAADRLGRTYAIWERDGAVRALIRDPNGGWQIADLSVEGRGEAPDIVADRSGNALTTWTQTTAAGSLLVFAPYDGAGPRLSRLRIPRRGRTGKPLRMSVSARDVWSSTGAIWWRFGDRQKRGAIVRHTYRYAGGTFRVQVRALDAAGNATTRSRTIRIRDVTRPRITRFRVGLSGRMRFRLTERARVRIRVSRLRAGRDQRVRTLTRKRRDAGRNRITLRLRPGHYFATIVATDPARHRSRPQSTSFRIR